jgi:hypothetical protein
LKSDSINAFEHYIRVMICYILYNNTNVYYYYYYFSLFEVICVERVGVYFEVLCSVLIFLKREGIERREYVCLVCLVCVCV